MGLVLARGNRKKNLFALAQSFLEIGFLHLDENLR